jgi:hypothetical protein
MLCRHGESESVAIRCIDSSSRPSNDGADVRAPQTWICSCRRRVVTERTSASASRAAPHDPTLTSPHPTRGGTIRGGAGLFGSSPRSDCCPLSTVALRTLLCLSCAGPHAAPPLRLQAPAARRLGALPKLTSHPTSSLPRVQHGTSHGHCTIQSRYIGDTAWQALG